MIKNRRHMMSVSCGDAMAALQTFGLLVGIGAGAARRARASMFWCTCSRAFIKRCWLRGQCSCGGHGQITWAWFTCEFGQCSVMFNFSQQETSSKSEPAQSSPKSTPPSTSTSLPWCSWTETKLFALVGILEENKCQPPKAGQSEIGVRLTAFHTMSKMAMRIL